VEGGNVAYFLRTSYLNGSYTYCFENNG